MEFTYKTYEKIIACLRNKEYSVRNYHDYFDSDKAVILRHDVDMSPKKALDFAEFESELGVKSTYFFLMSSDFYNIASKKNIEIISRIIDLGHEIGLHFDEVKYQENQLAHEDVLEKIILEKNTMETIVGQRISTVSMHRPSKETLDSDFKIEGMINSYSSTFFKGFKYISDSRHRWRENPFEVINDGNYKKLHILTHPFLYNTFDQSLKESINQFLDEAIYDRKNTIYDNITDLDSILKGE